MRFKSWTKEDLTNAVKTSSSVRQVLKYLKPKEAGGNYSQIKFIKEYKNKGKAF